MADDGITVTGPDIERDVQRVRNEIRPVINHAFHRHGNDLAQAAGARALTINLRSGKRGVGDTGLRRALQRAIGVQYENEKIIVTVHRSRMPSGKESIPLVSVSREWRHPVFGNRNVWVTQRGDVFWFGRSVYNEAARTIPPELEKLLKGLEK